MRRSRLRLLGLAATAMVLAGCQLSPPTYRGVKDPSLVSAASLRPCPKAQSAATSGLPKITLHCLDGAGTADLAGLRGPAIVNFWYSSCEPCNAEAGYLRQFDQAAQGKVAVIGIDTEPYPDNGLTFDAHKGIRFPSFIDEHNDVPPKVGVGTFPTTLFLDSAGHLVGPPQVDPFTSEAQVAAAVKSHLGITVS